MTALLSLVLLVLFSYLSSLIIQKVKINNIWIKGLTFTGSFYILLGILIGPKILGIVDQKIVEQLHVLYALVLGWVGFLIGLQTNFKGLRRFKKSYFVYASTNYLLALIITFIALTLIIPLISSLNPGNTALWVLSISGSLTTPIMMGVITRDHKVDGRVSHILQFISAYDNILAVLFFGLIMAFISSNQVFEYSIPGIVVLVVPILSALLCGNIYQRLTKELNSEQEQFLFIIGLLIFVVGIAYYLNQSLLFVSFLFGLVLSNTKTNTKSIYLNIQKVEKPLYILLLIFVGVNLTAINETYVLLLITFLIVHFVAKLSSGYFSNYLVPNNTRLNKSIGIANLGMGGLSLAMVLDYFLSTMSGLSTMFLFILAISILINDVISLRYLEKKLAR